MQQWVAAWTRSCTRCFLLPCHTLPVVQQHRWVHPVHLPTNAITAASFSSVTGKSLSRRTRRAVPLCFTHTCSLSKTRTRLPGFVSATFGFAASQLLMTPRAPAAGLMPPRRQTRRLRRKHGQLEAMVCRAARALFNVVAITGRELDCPDQRSLPQQPRYQLSVRTTRCHPAGHQHHRQDVPRHRRPNKPKQKERPDQVDGGARSRCQHASSLALARSPRWPVKPRHCHAGQAARHSGWLTCTQQTMSPNGSGRCSRFSSQRTKNAQPRTPRSSSLTLPTHRWPAARQTQSLTRSQSRLPRRSTGQPLSCSAMVHACSKRHLDELSLWMVEELSYDRSGSAGKKSCKKCEPLKG
eukprot:m.475728 g.475728  ORF g.475728 m.475728 type:complete len:354 (-) comp20398_c0_seq14:96-1157(-)